MNAPATETIEFAEEELAGKLLKILVAQLEGQREPWNSLPEGNQEVALNGMGQAVDAAVRGAVYTIASGKRSYLRASVESVTFKDGVKAVMSLPKDQGAHDLADAEGSTVLVVIADAEQFTGGTNKIEAAPEQHSLGLSTRSDLGLSTRSEPSAEPDREPEDEAPEGPEDPLPEPVPEVHKLKDGKFEIVVGADKLHYPGSPESFKSAARAEGWLQKHLETQEETTLTEVVAAFKAAGKAEGGKPDEERDYDTGFERAKKNYPADFCEEHYAELSAGYVEGYETGTSDE